MGAGWGAYYSWRRNIRIALHTHKKLHMGAANAQHNKGAGTYTRTHTHTAIVTASMLTPSSSGEGVSAGGRAAPSSTRIASSLRVIFLQDAGSGLPALSPMSTGREERLPP